MNAIDIAQMTTENIEGFRLGMQFMSDLSKSYPAPDALAEYMWAIWKTSTSDVAARARVQGFCRLVQKSLEAEGAK